MNTVVDAKGNVVIVTSSVRTARAVQKHGLQVVAPKIVHSRRKAYGA